MTSIRLTHTALAIAVAAALTSGVAAAAEQTMPSVNTDVLTGQSGDTLKTVSHQEYENKGTIKNFGTREKGLRLRWRLKRGPCSRPTSSRLTLEESVLW